MEIQAKNLPRLKIAESLSTFLPRFVFNVLNYIWGSFQLAYLGLSFVFLTYEKFNQMHKNLNYSLHFLIPLVTLLSIYLPKVRYPQPNEKQKAKTHWWKQTY